LKDFLEQKVKLVPGNIIDAQTGKVLGQHKGFPDQAAGGGGRSKAAETGGRKRHCFISEEPGSAL
jgi:tRNA U34 2-thiouridine synthase MnmA/TrmU